MSKSLGNYIGVTDTPDEMFGKVMSLPDAVMATYWILVTDAGADELATIERELADPKVNPMTIKKRLGERLVTMYHGADAATRARADFETQFSRREVPEHLEDFGTRQVEKAMGGVAKPFIVEFAVASGMAESKSAARRLVQQGAVSLDGRRVERIDELVELDREHVLRVGRRMKRYRPSPGA
jgi:tyrosyl-tRNA synthetase